MAAVKVRTKFKTLDVLGKVLNFGARSQPGEWVCLRLTLPSLRSGYLLETLVSYVEKPRKRILEIPSLVSCH